MGAFASASMCFILVSLCGTIVLLQRIKEPRSRFLICMVGLVAMLHGVRLLTAQGVQGLKSMAVYGGVADFLVAVLTLVALLILYGEALRHRLTRVQLRLSEANEQNPRTLSGKVVSAVFDPNRRHNPDGLGGRLPDEMVLNNLMQASPVAIVAFDESGKVCTCNRAAEQLYGAGEHELLGKQLPALGAKPKPDHAKRRALHPAEARL